MAVVKSADAPFLNELEDDEPPAEVGHAGELADVVKPLPPLKAAWRAPMGDGTTGEREGPMAEVSWTQGGSILYAFAKDLGDVHDVPTAQWICEQFEGNASLPETARRTRCTTLLRRVLLPSGAILAFAPCASGPCPVAVLRDGKVGAVAVDGIVSGRVVPGGKDGIALLSTRWTRADGKWSGGTLVPVALSGGRPKRLADIPTDEVDARDQLKVSSREVKVQITQPVAGGSLVRVSGRRRLVNGQDGRELSTAPIDERRSFR
jgi:hypothetical protein